MVCHDPDKFSENVFFESGEVMSLIGYVFL